MKNRRLSNTITCPNCSEPVKAIVIKSGDEAVSLLCPKCDYEWIHVVENKD